MAEGETTAWAPVELSTLPNDLLDRIALPLLLPLQPAALVSLASTCAGFERLLRPRLRQLELLHRKAGALCARARSSCAEFHCARQVVWNNCKLSESDCKQLERILTSQPLPHLQLLWLTFTQIGDVGCALLSGALACHATPNLTTLTLYHNGIGPTGCEALAAALGSGAVPNLLNMNLGHNPIGDYGCEALSGALGSLHQLTTLGVHNDGIGSRGIRTLGAALTKGCCPHLRELYLAGNPCAQGTLRSIEEICRRRGFSSDLLALQEFQNSQVSETELW